MLTRVYPALQGGSGSGSQNRVFGEVPGGTAPVFTTALDFVAGSEVVLLNGVRQKEGVGCDYVRSESGGVGTGFDTITFQFTLHSSDSVAVDYNPA